MGPSVQRKMMALLGRTGSLSLVIGERAELWPSTQAVYGRNFVLEAYGISLLVLSIFQ